MAFILRTAAAGLIGAVSYLFVRSALHPHGWGLQSSLSDSENYLAIGIAVIVFGFVLWRLCKQTWGKEQMEQLWDIDD
ncbi:hypothetical protein GTP46_18730 [Duganella sp. FT135W]|uniref:Uncharacterized protein n=1 Tax=Duganella flavida TaxID=2692175 RepID=A0A6L8KBD2_9BURK|nr:hypothetical protein [Duganella flavida]MYM24676.1 hypothetical protein [Duganella flavida]